jgi:hypothetical protein
MVMWLEVFPLMTILIQGRIIFLKLENYVSKNIGPHI